MLSVYDVRVILVKTASPAATTVSTSPPGGNQVDGSPPAVLPAVTRSMVDRRFQV